VFRRRVISLFRPKHDYLPGTTIFRAIDIDLVAEELELASKGAADGKSNIPSDRARTLSVAEKTISRSITHYWTEAVEGARRAYESLLGRAASLGAETEIDLLQAKPGEVAGKLAQAAREERDTLLDAYDRMERAEDKLTAFVAKEGIERDVRRPLSAPLKTTLLAIAVVLELAVNTSIFSEGNQHGLAGAFLKVIVIPVFNVGVTFALVRAFCRQILRPFPMAAFGALMSIVTAVYIFGLNLAVAHWRDSMSGRVTLDAGTIAFSRVFTHTFELASDNSWILFGIGCVAALIAATDAWLWDDPHPGFWKLSLAIETERLNFDNERAYAVERIESLSSGALADLQDQQRKAETAKVRYPELAAQAQALSEDLTAYREHLVDIAEELAGRYREANMAARSAPAPRHFEDDVPIELPIPTFGKFPLSPSNRTTAGLLASAISQISEAESSAKASLPTLGELEHKDA
jgi:hypothetical protein